MMAALEPSCPELSEDVWQSNTTAVFEFGILLLVEQSIAV